ncbi:MAG: hypothetical protein ABI024_05945 [Vicinamibacterales bacterium]
MPSVRTAHFTPLARSTTPISFSGIGGVGGGPLGTGVTRGASIAGWATGDRGGEATTLG